MFVGFTEKTSTKAPKLSHDKTASSVERKKLLNVQTCGYYLSIADGTLYSENGDKEKAYFSPLLKIYDYSEITATHDQKEGTINFVINGKDYGVAFKGIAKDAVLFSIIEMNEKYQKVYCKVVTDK